MRCSVKISVCMVEQEQGPQSLIEFIGMIIKAYITGIPSVIKGMVVSAVISAVLGNAVHFYLMGWLNDGWNNGGNPWLDPIIFLVGQNPAKVMLFYFMVTYMFWWVIGMFRSKGIGQTIKLIATTPLGVAVSFVLGLTVLSKATAITSFLMMLTILISQEESLFIMGLQLGFKDVSGIVNKGKQATIPSPETPTAAMLGACIGFGYMAFFNTNPTVIGGIAVLAIAGLIYMFVQGRKGQTAAVYSTLLFLVLAGTLLAPNVLADDGGIPENGGWSNLPKNMWLVNELIKKGYPASAAAVMAASWVAGLFSQPVMAKIKPLTDKHVEPDWSGYTKDGKVSVPKYVLDNQGTYWTKDPNGTWLRADPNGTEFLSDGVTKATRYIREKKVETKGLSKSIMDAEDSPLLGDRVRIYTMEPPKDQGLLDNVSNGINGLDPFYTDKLHPDTWKNLKPGQKGVVMQEINKVLQKEFGVEYEFKVSNDSDKNLGGYYSPGDKPVISLNANGHDFDDPRTAIRTLIHEARHAYQDQNAKNSGDDYAHMSQYNNENNNYQTSEVDYIRYSDQFIEKDSRNFSHNATNQLIDQLNAKWGH